MSPTTRQRALARVVLFALSEAGRCDDPELRPWMRRLAKTFFKQGGCVALRTIDSAVFDPPPTPSNKRLHRPRPHHCCVKGCNAPWDAAPHISFDAYMAMPGDTRARRLKTHPDEHIPVRCYLCEIGQCADLGHEAIRTSSSITRESAIRDARASAAEGDFDVQASRPRGRRR